MGTDCVYAIIWCLGQRNEDGFDTHDLVANVRWDAQILILMDISVRRLDQEVENSSSVVSLLSPALICSGELCQSAYGMRPFDVSFSEPVVDDIKLL